MVNHLSNGIFDQHSGVSEGVGTLSSDWIYRTENSANQWILLTQSPDYPYYRVELELLTRTLENSDILGSTRFFQVVCVGAADGKKEIMIGLRAIGNRSSSEFVLVDSSPALLSCALDKFCNIDSYKTRGILLDIRNKKALKETLENGVLPRGAPRLFTMFGNMVGNYEGLSMVSSLHQTMAFGDRLVFGAHLKDCTRAGKDYPAYRSAAYYNHMASVLRDVGVDPKFGVINTIVNSTQDGLVDVVEIFFDFNLDLVPNLSSELSDGTSVPPIRRIRVDVSCKFSMAFLLSELSCLGWYEQRYWISDCGRNVIFSCRK